MLFNKKLTVVNEMLCLLSRCDSLKARVEMHSSFEILNLLHIDSKKVNIFITLKHVPLVLFYFSYNRQTNSNNNCANKGIINQYQLSIMARHMPKVFLYISFKCWYCEYYWWRMWLTFSRLIMPNQETSASS